MIKLIAKFLFIALFIACNSKKEKKPYISNFKLSADTISFYSKMKDDTSHFFVTLTNTNSDTLIRVLNTSASCECTSIIVDTNFAIKKGESIKVGVTYKHNGLESSGLKNLVIETNVQPQFTIIYLKEDKRP